MYSMSSRVGDLIMLIGMTGRDEEGVIVDGVRAQTERALERIEAVLTEHGLDRKALVRLRVYMTDVGDWEVVKGVIDEFLEEVWPPAVAMAVTALVDPAMKVELEADAAASGG